MTYHVATISQRQSFRRNQNYIKHGRGFTATLGPITNFLFIAVLVSIMGLIYLTQVTKTSSYGYKVNALQTHHQELLKENQSLKVESARLQALERIKTSSVARNLEDINSADYANN